jgi:hypothetical protein
LLQQSRLAQLYRDFHAKALVLVNPTELEIFYRDLLAKSLLLVNPTVLEIFWQDLYTKALILVSPALIKILNPLRRPRGFRRCRAPTWFLLPADQGIRHGSEL